jgi:hypothetical protein
MDERLVPRAVSLDADHSDLWVCQAMESSLLDLLQELATDTSSVSCATTPAYRDASSQSKLESDISSTLQPHETESGFASESDLQSEADWKPAAVDRVPFLIRQRMKGSSGHRKKAEKQNVNNELSIETSNSSNNSSDFSKQQDLVSPQTSHCQNLQAVSSRHQLCACASLRQGRGRPRLDRPKKKPRGLGSGYWREEDDVSSSYPFSEPVYDAKHKWGLGGTLWRNLNLPWNLDKELNSLELEFCAQKGWI